MQFIVALSVAALVLVLALRKKSSVTARTSTGQRFGNATLQARNPWRATSIVYNNFACSAVKTIGNKRFLDIDKNIPALALANCDAFACNCRYAYHDDRREYNEDRRSPGSLRSDLYDKPGEADRRQNKRGRRRTDWG